MTSKRKAVNESETFLTLTEHSSVDTDDTQGLSRMPTTRIICRDNASVGNMAPQYLYHLEKIVARHVSIRSNMAEQRRPWQGNVYYLYIQGYRLSLRNQKRDNKVN